jgi:hypothetical protein
MAKKDKGGKYNKSKPGKGAKQRNRDKKHDRFGNEYDKRNGTWTERDHAEEEFGRGLARPEWITPERANAELAVMNFPGKRGPPFTVAPCVIMYLFRLKAALNLGYRTVAGIVKGVLELEGIKCPTYSAACKLAAAYCGTDLGKAISSKASDLADRLESFCMGLICDTDTEIPQDVSGRELMTVRTIRPPGPEERERVVAIDSTGISTAAGGLWSHSVWGTDIDGWVRIHALVDTDTGEVLSFVPTSDKAGDSPILPPLVEAAVRAGYRIKRVLADGAYDSIENWLALERMGIEFVVNMKDTARIGMKSFPRNEEIRIRKTVGHDLWVILFGYGRRWLVEVFFSVFKRVLGSSVFSKTFAGIARETDMRMELYCERQAMLIERLVEVVRD